MTAELTEAPPILQHKVGFAIEPWAPQQRRLLAEILVSAYAGMREAALYPELGTVADCTRLLQKMETAHTDFLLACASGLILADGQPVGSILAVQTAAGSASIEHLGILAAFRNRGLGKLLLQWSVRELWQAGFRRIQLHVTAQNEPAIRLYSGAGFVCLGIYRARDPRSEG